MSDYPIDAAARLAIAQSLVLIVGLIAMQSLVGYLYLIRVLDIISGITSPGLWLTLPRSAAVI